MVVVQGRPNRTLVAFPFSAAVLCAIVVALAACGRSPADDDVAEPPQRTRPSILLVTLDTTRADAIGPDARGVETPSFNALASRGMRYTRAYSTVPETLPSHTSMMTGLYPGGHGIHENGRTVGAQHPLIAERLHQAGYHTAAFVSSFVLARRFGLARGFDVYDDELPDGASERSSRATTDRALVFLAAAPDDPLFLWVHYFDPHAPYTPPAPFLQRFSKAPYLGEVAAMDDQLGRLLAAFHARARGAGAVIVAGDHGEGLGDHGEAQHGMLLYQPTVLVPLVVSGPGVQPGVTDVPVSTRRIFGTALAFAGIGGHEGLTAATARPEVVLGEAMKPFLGYGWQPQTMAVAAGKKAILAGKMEVYDVEHDPAEARDLGSGASLPAGLTRSLRDYPVPLPGTGGSEPRPLDANARERLASLGYVSAGAAPVVRKDAPRPADMTALFDLLDRASGLFVRQRYTEAVPLLERIVAADPHNLDAQLRLATAHSSLGHDARALEAFTRASQLAPDSQDVRMYLGLHYARGKDWARAVPLLEQVIAADGERLPALEALALLRERQGRIADAVALRQKILALRRPSAGELVALGRLAMSAGQTQAAIDAFEAARARNPGAFGHDLELGVLYLAARRLPEARAALDRVPASDPRYPMALFKRAQVSVLLNEPEQGSRIEAARRHADAATRPLIARERLFER